MSKDATYRRLIQSRRWRVLRVQMIKQRPYCEECFKNGLRVGATEVHHIEPVETAASDSEKESLMFNPANLMTLCHACHSRIHREMRVHSKQTVKARQKHRIEAALKAFFPGVDFTEVRPGG